MAKFVKTVFCSNCNKNSNLFTHLSEEEISLINDNRHEVRFNSGETIFKQGGMLTHVACVISGMAKIYIEGHHNKNLLLKVVKSSELIGGPGLFVDFRLHYTVSALTEVVACFIDAKVYQEIIKKNPVFAFEQFKQINTYGINNFEMLTNLTQKQMPGRIADTLLYLSEKVYESDKFTVHINRQDIADLSAMSKESAIRILKEFKDSGYISCVGNDFSIHDIDALKKLSQTG